MKEEVTAREDHDVIGRLVGFELMQFELECANSAIIALRLAEENMDFDGVMEKALYVVSAFTGDLVRRQREWYEDIKKAADLH